ncbi:unnamed protein product [Somion occarium]
MQCQNCWISYAHNVKLFRCGGCNIEYYCSKACQKQAWPSHKQKCKLNQAFTSKHRPTLTSLAVCALELEKDPKRSMDYIVSIPVHTRRGSKRPETSFFAVDVELQPIDELPQEQAEEMHEQLRLAHERSVKVGMIGVLFVMLKCIDTGVANIVPSAFADDLRQ